MKALINDWLTHQRKKKTSAPFRSISLCVSNEKHLMFDTQDEGGRSRAHPFWAVKEKLTLSGADYCED